MIPRYRVLRQRIEEEMAEVHQAAGRAIEAQRLALLDDRHAAFYLDSVAINLHGVHGGIERVLEWGARELAGGLPSGPAWHRDLLSQTTLEVEGVRPAVMRSGTAEALAEYLRFRRLVRNLYTWSFAADRLGALVAGLPDTLATLGADLAGFGRFLDAASLADESEGGITTGPRDSHADQPSA